MLFPFLFLLVNASAQKKFYNYGLEEYKTGIKYLKESVNDTSLHIMPQNAVAELYNAGYDIVKYLESEKPKEKPEAAYYFCMAMTIGAPRFGAYSSDYKRAMYQLKEYFPIAFKYKQTADLYYAYAKFNQDWSSSKDALNAFKSAATAPVEEPSACFFLKREFHLTEEGVQQMYDAGAFSMNYVQFTNKLNNSNVDSAIALTPQFQKLFPENIYTPNEVLMRAYSIKNDFKKALEHAETIMSANLSFTPGEDFYYTAALLYDINGDLKTALTTLNKVNIYNNQKYKDYYYELKRRDAEKNNPELVNLINALKGNDYSKVSDYIAANSLWSNRITHYYSYAGTTPYKIDREIFITRKNGSLKANLFTLVTIQNNATTALNKFEEVEYYLANDYAADVTINSSSISFSNKQTYFEYAGYNEIKTMFFKDDAAVLPVILKKKCGCTQPENIAYDIDNFAKSSALGTATLHADYDGVYLEINGEKFYSSGVISDIDKQAYANIVPNVTAASLSRVINYQPGSPSASSSASCTACGGTGKVQKYGKHLASVAYKDSRDRVIYHNLEPVEGTYYERCNKCSGTGKVN